MVNTKMIKFFLLTLCISLLCVSDAFADSTLFSELTSKGSEIFTGMRDIIYVVSGFGIVAVAIGGFFGTFNWKWLSSIIVGLMVLATTAAWINYVTDGSGGSKIGDIEDTLK